MFLSVFGNDAVAGTVGEAVIEKCFECGGLKDGDIVLYIEYLVACCESLEGFKAREEAGNDIYFLLCPQPVVVAFFLR